MRKRLLFLAVMMAAVLAAVVGYAYRFHGPGALRAYVRELRNKGEKVTFKEMLATFSTNSVGLSGGPVKFCCAFRAGFL
jgi:hypothetical protein